VLALPCAHPAVLMTAELAVYERLKLQLLNLGHTYLAERWLRDARPVGGIVREAMADTQLRNDLEAVWAQEVVPVFVAEGLGNQARSLCRRGA
jgi:tagaturonate reductase